jgi:hypothetical protein
VVQRTSEGTSHQRTSIDGGPSWWKPYAIVGFQKDWALTASHELLEILADPFGKRLIAGDLLDQAIVVGDSATDSTLAIGFVCLATPLRAQFCLCGKLQQQQRLGLQHRCQRGRYVKHTKALALEEDFVMLWRCDHGEP